MIIKQSDFRTWVKIKQIRQICLNQSCLLMDSIHWFSILMKESGMWTVDRKPFMLSVIISGKNNNTIDLFIQDEPKQYEIIFRQVLHFKDNTCHISLCDVLCFVMVSVWASPLIFYGHHRRCLNRHIFSTLGLSAACWAHFMCHHELWPTSVSHTFSFNSSLGLTRGKYYQKITVPIFKILLFQIDSLIFFSVAIFS